ncbi:glycine, alanine and asparagine-rich protein-like [Drosophila ficusphila]|uniref:glycine, alanine and asparagine-rich protein-like n=1 Tax=Drosophila ficusphila TaxID=30025 RepID=UPI001C8961D5|nr:glycine, alanine and asparagine-rich protein-like [Drosophila ficusphila]
MSFDEEVDGGPTGEMETVELSSTEDEGDGGETVTPVVSSDEEGTRWANQARRGYRQVRRVVDAEKYISFGSAASSERPEDEEVIEARRRATVDSALAAAVATHIATEDAATTTAAAKDTDATTTAATKDTNATTTAAEEDAAAAAKDAHAAEEADATVAATAAARVAAEDAAATTAAAATAAKAVIVPGGSTAKTADLDAGILPGGNLGRGPRGHVAGHGTRGGGAAAPSREDPAVGTTDVCGGGPLPGEGSGRGGKGL